MNKLAALASVALLALVVAPSAIAKPRASDRVVITGGTSVGPGQTAGTVVVVDGPVNVAGHVTGDVVSLAGPIRISGRVDGTVTAAAERVTLAPGARIGGDLQYGDKKPIVAGGATVGGEVRNENWSDVGNAASVIGALTLWLAFTVSALVLGLILLLLAPRAADAAYNAARERLGPAIGWGAALFFGLPIAAIVALVTLVGIPLGVAVLLALLPLGAIGYVTSAFLLGRLVLSNPPNRYVAFLAGLGMLRLAALVPILGGLVWFAATAFGLGVLLVAVWRARDTGATVASASPVSPAHP